MLTFAKVLVEGADPNDTTAYTTVSFPTSPELRYYLSFTKGGFEYGRSYVFGVASDGTHEFENYVFPTAGSWSVLLKNAVTDATVATQAVTVQAAPA